MREIYKWSFLKVYVKQKIKLWTNTFIEVIEITKMTLVVRKN